jgi:ankyrin repeat protein
MGNVWNLAAEGKTEALSAALAAGASPEAMADGRETALIAAASNGHLECVSLLLAHKAKVAAKTDGGKTALMGAAAGGHAEVVRALLDKKANPDLANKLGMGPLHVAAAHPAVVESLLVAKADPNLASKSGRTPLMFARRADVAELLVKAGARLEAADSEGETPLHHAASAASEDVVRYLLGQGASADAVDSSGKTPLLLAIRSEPFGKAPGAALQLIAHTTLLEARGYRGQTALSTACEAGFLAPAEALAAKGADLNTRDNAGMTPLMWAAAYGRLDVVDWLLARGADAALGDKKDKRAVDHAREDNHAAVVARLGG